MFKFDQAANSIFGGLALRVLHFLGLKNVCNARRLISSFLAILTLTNPASADTKFFGGTASFIYHNSAFKGLVSSFVGSYSPSNQLIWNSVSIDTSSVVGSGSAPTSSVEFYPITSSTFGVSKSTPQFLDSGLELVTKASVNSTTYYFPDGILPVIDPLYLDIVSLDIEAFVSKEMQIGSIGKFDITGHVGGGAFASAIASHLEWVFWDAKDNIFVAEPFARAGLQVGTKNTAVELSVSVLKSGSSQLQFSYQIGL